MKAKPIITIIQEAVDSGKVDLPVFPEIARRLYKVVQSEDYGLVNIVKIIEKDQALASQVLKLANSSFYAGLNPAKTLHDATVRLGMKTIFNLVMIVTQKEVYRSRNEELDHMMAKLWIHALGTAFAACWVSLRLGMKDLADESFLGGLLHDIGKLLLLRILDGLKECPKNKWDISMNLVHEIIQTMHASQGERLMRRQNLPDGYCQVVGMHHDAAATENPVLNLVKLGNLACHKLGVGLKHHPEILLSETPEAVSLMAKDLLLAELLVQLEEYQSSVQKINLLH